MAQADGHHFPIRRPPVILNLKFWILVRGFLLYPKILRRTQFKESLIIFHWNVAIYQFSKWWSSAILDLQILKSFTCDRHHSRILQPSRNLRESLTRSCRVISKTMFSNMTYVSHLEFKNLNFFVELFSSACDRHTTICTLLYLYGACNKDRAIKSFLEYYFIYTMSMDVYVANLSTVCVHI